MTGKAVWAQGTDLGGLRVTVTDQIQAVIPGAHINVVDQKTKQAVGDAVTDASGAYEVRNPRYGTYLVTISKPSFGTTSRSIDLHGSQLLVDFWPGIVPDCP